MRTALSIMLIATGLTACATPYRPPTEPPPAQWTGASGWEPVAGTQKIYEGTHKQGDVLFEFVLKPRRTGTVVETVQTKTAYGKDFIIPKGTPVFAENFTLVTHGGWTGKEIKQPIDPIEWCAVLPHGTDGKQTGSDTACLFWEGPNQARYMQDYRNGGFGYNPAYYDTSGMPGPVPQINDTPVDLGVEVKQQLRIVKLDDRRIEMQSYLTDGTSDRQISRERPAYWGKSRSIKFTVGDMKFQLAPAGDPTTVQFARAASEE
jgi:hypothetical protein